MGDSPVEERFLDVELEEKVVIRERRKKILLIILSFILFFVLCSFPVYEERLPKWESLAAARLIAVEVEKMKTESIQSQKPVQLTVFQNGKLIVETVSKCGDSLSSVGLKVIREVQWKPENRALSILIPEKAKEMKLSRVVEGFCFDPVLGLPQPEQKKVLIILPVKDLSVSRLDRASYLEVESTTAEISIN